MQLSRRGMRRSRIDLVRIEVMSEVLRQEHILVTNLKTKASTGNDTSLFK
jgi:hypothetical protein